jgi:hypothetical protein
VRTSSRNLLSASVLSGTSGSGTRRQRSVSAVDSSAGSVPDVAIAM